jgi:hypothetical protein
MKQPKPTRMKSQESDNIEYLLYNTDNYKPVIKNTITDILNKFICINIEYLRFISEKITIKNRLYYKFIVERGIETLSHIFLTIFFYTKNLDITFYHSQKAYYCYIEFIEQISDESASFLQLSSRDAILFVYKKTIFELNNEYRKNIPELSQNEENTLSYLNEYTKLYQTIFLFVINNKEFKYDTKVSYIHMCCDCIEFISNTLNKKPKKNIIECIYLFIHAFENKSIQVKQFFFTLDEYVKKLISKKQINTKNIKSKIDELILNDDSFEQYDASKILYCIFDD